MLVKPFLHRNLTTNAGLFGGYTHILLKPIRNVVLDHLLYMLPCNYRYSRPLEVRFLVALITAGLAQTGWKTSSTCDIHSFFHSSIHCVIAHLPVDTSHSGKQGGHRDMHVRSRPETGSDSAGRSSVLLTVCLFNCSHKRKLSACG